MVGIPIETLYHRGGDCEDTSILCTALFDAAGYRAGVFVIPGHTMAAVALEDHVFAELPPYQQWRYHQFAFDTGDDTFYGCETSLDGYCLGTGFVPRKCSVPEKGLQILDGSDPDERYGLCILGR